MTSSLSVVNACVKQTIYASASIFTASTAILAYYKFLVLPLPWATPLKLKIEVQLLLSRNENRFVTTKDHLNCSNHEKVDQIKFGNDISLNSSIWLWL